MGPMGKLNFWAAVTQFQDSFVINGFPNPDLLSCPRSCMEAGIIP